MRRAVMGIFAAMLLGGVLFLYFGIDMLPTSLIADYYVANSFMDTGAENAVAAIYLNYRMFDSLFETLMLIVSVTAVIHLSWRNGLAITSSKTDAAVWAGKERAGIRKKGIDMLIAHLVGFLYPFMFLIALYIILNGHSTPGGGFQGGAILASAAVSRYLTQPFEDINMSVLQRIEKLLFLGIIILPVILLFIRPGILSSPWDRYYLVMMNILIGLKVGAGLSVVFYRFVFYEGVRHELH